MKFDRRSLLKSAVASLAYLVPSVASAAKTARFMEDRGQRFQGQYSAFYADFRNLSLEQLHGIMRGPFEIPAECMYGWGPDFFWIQAREYSHELLKNLCKNARLSSIQSVFSPTPINIFQPMNELYHRSTLICRVRPDYDPDQVRISTNKNGQLCCEKGFGQV